MTYCINPHCPKPVDTVNANNVTALSAAMRYILKAESDDRRGARRKLYHIIAGSAVFAITVGQKYCCKVAIG